MFLSWLSNVYGNPPSPSMSWHLFFPSHHFYCLLEEQHFSTLPFSSCYCSFGFLAISYKLPILSIKSETLASRRSHANFFLYCKSYYLSIHIVTLLCYHMTSFSSPRLCLPPLSIVSSSFHLPPKPASIFSLMSIVLKRHAIQFGRSAPHFLH